MAVFWKMGLCCLGNFCSVLCCLLTTSPWQPRRGDTCIFSLHLTSLALGLTQPCQDPNRSCDRFKSMLEIRSKRTCLTSPTCLLWLGHLHLHSSSWLVVPVTCTIVSGEVGKVSTSTLDSGFFGQTMASCPCSSVFLLPAVGAGKWGRFAQSWSIAWAFT